MSTPVLNLKRTPLFQWHKEHQASLVEFCGWEMPVVYTQITEEHLCVRKKAGLFDISHMGQVMVRGTRSLEYLQAITSNDVSKLGPGRMQYSTLPAEDGTLIDDIIVTCLGKEEYFVVINAGNTDEDLKWMQEQAGKFDVEVKHLPRAMFALQGAASQKILQPLVALALEELSYYHLAATTLAGKPVLVSRSGYTGEDGFEICLENEDAPAFWQQIMDAGKVEGLLPIGLGARNTLRMEMGYALYGHEIDRSTNPLEAGLGWVVKLDKGSFVGRQAILSAQAAGLNRKLVGFEMLERGIARDGYPVVNEKGEAIGKVTSGGPSPSLGKNIGMAYVPKALSALGSEFLIQVRDKALRAKVVPKPFVEPHVRKN